MFKGGLYRISFNYQQHCSLQENRTFKFKIENDDNFLFSILPNYCFLEVGAQFLNHIFSNLLADKMLPLIAPSHPENSNIRYQCKLEPTQYNTISSLLLYRQIYSSRREHWSLNISLNILLKVLDLLETKCNPLSPT